ncbi:MAG TPA: Crp/Fnr family transcriptional regulator [Alphaproteobacteria bacterium]
MTDNPDAVAAILKNLSYLKDAGAQALQDLAAIVTLRDLKAGEQIIHDGDAGEEAYLVISGVLVVKKKLEDGRDKLIALIGPGSIAGEMALLTRDPRSADVYAHIDSKVAVLNKKAFDLFRGSGPHIADKLLRDMTRRQRGAINRLRDANWMLLPTRLAITLGDLGRDFGMHENNAVRITLPLTSTDLADLAVCTSNEAAMLLTEWDMSGFIKKDGDLITLLKPEEF